MNWGLRDYQIGADAMGLEPRPDCAGWATGAACGACYVCHMVEVFRAVRRVLRDDGTLWLNLGDSYASGEVGRHDGYNPTREHGSTSHKPFGLRQQVRLKTGLKPKDLCGLPWRCALALQADGWLLRSDIIWAKSNPMPESVRDRPTKAHEYVFLLAKKPKYFFDSEAIKEDGAGRLDRSKGSRGRLGKQGWTAQPLSAPAGRNRRSVWTLATQPLKAAHFATFPPRLVEPCLLAGTSEAGACAACGQPWLRVVERLSLSEADLGRRPQPYVGKAVMERHDGAQVRAYSRSSTLGFRPACRCEADVVPCVVLDPFAGAGTVALVAAQHGRRSIGMELNPAYIALAEARLKEVS